MIRKVEKKDTSEIVSIYNYYVRETAVTFDIKEWNDVQMNEKIEKISENYPYLVVEEEGRVLGYAYAGEWKAKDAYKRTVESTVYLHPDARGRGLGAKLYTQLLGELKAGGYRVVIGCITVPNDASIALHEKLGFGKVAVFRQLGEKFGKLHNVGYWQLMLD